ncbi:uncharacterized protein N7459_000554 [Penicillium hispanicum]|uniref:uncharacterized protein n=1 Tax=Penicillium hispanicum TaxID=1080232 RepID=UPI00253F8263|nr:uncharacterized protein N7459_000554 [Penicillium hispanicum]KAJ5594346.1 hypothetical protein N7459_000554 [Penicillium hispanicum]
MDDDQSTGKESLFVRLVCEADGAEQVPPQAASQEPLQEVFSVPDDPVPCEGSDPDLGPLNAAVTCPTLTDQEPLEHHLLTGVSTFLPELLGPPSRSSLTPRDPELINDVARAPPRTPSCLSLSKVNEEVISSRKTSPPGKALQAVEMMVSDKPDLDMSLDGHSLTYNPKKSERGPDESHESDISKSSTKVDDALQHDEGSTPPPSQKIKTSLHLNPQSPSVAYPLSIETACHQTREAAPSSPLQQPWSPTVSYSVSPTTGLVRIEEETPAGHEVPMSLPSSPETSSISLIWSYNQVIGPSQPFPDHLRTILEGWHEIHPDMQPPCSLRVRATEVLYWDPFKVFDQDGENHELSVFIISVKKRKQLKYCVMVLHAENNPAELVAVSQARPKFKSSGYRGVYLVAWLGWEQRYDSEVCAIRVWRTDGQPVTFKADFFDNAVGTISPARYATSGNAADPTSRTQTTTPRPPNSPESANRWISIPSTPKTPQTPRTPRTPMDVILIDSSSSDCTESASEPQVKRPKTTSRRDSSDLPVARRLFTSPNVRFKLLSDTTPNVRLFPLEGCDMKTLFKKAREFYNEAKVDAEMGLWCKVPGQLEQRYIGEGCEDEFKILCDDIRRLSVSDSRAHVIELKHAGY